MSVLASTNVEDNDDELGFGKKILHKYANEENIDDLNKYIVPESSDSELETEAKREARLWKEALIADLKNENPDMSDDSLDEYASDYEQKRIDRMEKEMSYLKKSVEESKIGSKNYETK